MLGTCFWRGNNFISYLLCSNAIPLGVIKIQIFQTRKGYSWYWKQQVSIELPQCGVHRPFLTPPPSPPRGILKHTPSLTDRHVPHKGLCSLVVFHTPKQHSFLILPPDIGTHKCFPLSIVSYTPTTTLLSARDPSREWKHWLLGQSSKVNSVSE